VEYYVNVTFAFHDQVVWLVGCTFYIVQIEPWIFSRLMAHDAFTQVRTFWWLK